MSFLVKNRENHIPMSTPSVFFLFCFCCYQTLEPFVSNGAHAALELGVGPLTGQERRHPHVGGVEPGTSGAQSFSKENKA